MKYKTLLAIFTSLLAILGASPAAVARGRTRANADFTREGLPNILSTTAYVIDLADGSLLYEKDPDVVRPLASLSKMMSAIVISTTCSLKWDELHEMSTANRDAAKGGDKTKLSTGWQFTHRDLLYAALMRSDNRALPALGEACGLTPAQLGERMTEKARTLGLTHTFFREPTGLSQENVSTAREIMVILKEAIKVPEIATIMGTKEFEITAHKGTATRKIKIRNTDRMLGKETFEILGGKTGYTDPARYCLAIAARLPEKRSIGMVFLGAEGRFTRFADFTRVIKWVARLDQDHKDDGDLQIAEGAQVRTRVVPAGRASRSIADKARAGLDAAKAAAAAATKIVVPEAKADTATKPAASAGVTGIAGPEAKPVTPPSGSASTSGDSVQSLKW